MVNGMHLRQRAKLKVKKNTTFFLLFSPAISLTIFPLNVDELMLRLVLRLFVRKVDSNCVKILLNR